MRVFLETFLPRTAPSLAIRVRSYDGKRNLLGKLESRLRSYNRSLRTDERIMVLVDRDEQDCVLLKQQMEGIASNAGLATRSNPGPNAWQVVNRIVIKELEAWYFGDWDAVRSAYPKVSANVPKRPAYRDPDAIAGPTFKKLERILRDANYFMDGVSKSDLARDIAIHMDPSRNTSASFRAFNRVICEMVSW